jgi:integrase
MIQHRDSTRRTAAAVTTAAQESTRRTRRVAFNARSIGRLTPEAQAVDWFDVTTPGLSMRVTPAGARTWYAFYKKGRVTRRVKLGLWPALKLSKARELARETRVDVETEGADPAHDRRAARDVFTVGDLAKLYIEQYATPHKRTWKDDQWRLARYVLPAWKSRPIGEITRADVHVILDKIAADGKPIQANRVQALLSKLWNFAIDREHATVNPCYRMSKAAPERTRAMVLDDEAIRALWRALDAQPGDATDALRLRLVTGQRGGEVHQMQWTEVDLPADGSVRQTGDAGVWTIPAERAKNGRAHRVPLSVPAADVLRARLKTRPKDEARVFPGLYHQRDDLRELATIHGDAYRWHDLRRTVATRLASLGIGEETIGRVLNHAKRGVTATVYNQHQYDAEKQRALDAWARELARIVTDAPTGAVLPFARA